MKKILILFAAMSLLAACNTKVAPLQNESKQRNEISFKEADHYFFKGGQEIPSSAKVTTQEDFDRLFGMAAVMGVNGQPTEIDFNKQFILAIVKPITNIETEINPVKLEENGDTLFYTYELKKGETMSSSMQPCTIIILDKEYENKELQLIEK